MNVVECDVPSGSMLSRDVIEHAYFRDSCRAPLSRRDLGIVDVFFAIFAHHPLWMKLLRRPQQDRLPCRPGCTDRVRNPPRHVRPPGPLTTGRSRAPAAARVSARAPSYHDRGRGSHLAQIADRPAMTLGSPLLRFAASRLPP